MLLGELMKAKKSARHLAAQMYQVVGYLGLGGPDNNEVIDEDEVRRILDYLSAVAYGIRNIDKNILPFHGYKTKEEFSIKLTPEESKAVLAEAQGRNDSIMKPLHRRGWNANN
jgi:hypothetical protein